MSDALDDGPFFHGTKADLRPGDLLTAGFHSNYRPEIVMNHIYFTAVADGAGLAAELAPGDREPRVYEVEPTGDFENDPNVTDKKFPGNPTRSYRSASPLRVVREVLDWTRLSPEALATWRERLAALHADDSAEIINSAAGLAHLQDQSTDAGQELEFGPASVPWFCRRTGGAPVTGPGPQAPSGGVLRFGRRECEDSSSPGAVLLLRRSAGAARSLPRRRRDRISAARPAGRVSRARGR